MIVVFILHSVSRYYLSLFQGIQALNWTGIVGILNKVMPRDLTFLGGINPAKPNDSLAYKACRPDPKRATDRNMALPPSNTVAVIGAGSVGSAIAQSLILRRVVAELVIVDVDEALCRGQVLDLSDAASLMNIRVRQGCHSDAGKSDIIIISSGAKQRPGETRLSLIDRNLHILRSVLEAMKPIRSDAILLLVANPVDVLTYFAQQLSGLPRSQVLGSGTLLDSVRLRGILGPKLQVAETAINAYVVGEHGDSQCVGWPCSAKGLLLMMSILMHLYIIRLPGLWPE